MTLKNKIYKNALITEKLVKLDKKERQRVVKELLKTHTQRGLAEELGIPHSTIHDWASLRQDNTGANVHISLGTIVQKLKHFEPKEQLDFILLKEIKTIAEKKLKNKKWK